MKAFSSLLTFALLGTLLIYSGCGGGSSETLQQKNFKQFANKPWKVSSVSYNGVDSTANWTNFQITFADSSNVYTYKCTNRPSLSVWPQHGTWAFDNTNPQNTIDRDPNGANLPIGYVLGANGSTLQLSFNYSSTTYYTRTQNLGGAWIFNLIPQ